jgi:hypothetical protein
MKDAMLDRILANEEELIPSSGFAASVMDRIREEAAAPQPIPFPWKRAVPGIALAAAVFGWSAFELTRRALAQAHSVPPVPLHLLHLSLSALPPVESVGWVAIALGLSLASWTLARFMTGASRPL